MGDDFRLEINQQIGDLQNNIAEYQLLISGWNKVRTDDNNRAVKAEENLLKSIESLGTNINGTIEDLTTKYMELKSKVDAGLNVDFTEIETKLTDLLGKYEQAVQLSTTNQSTINKIQSAINKINLDIQDYQEFKIKMQGTPLSVNVEDESDPQLLGLPLNSTVFLGNRGFWYEKKGLATFVKMQNQ